MKKKAVLGIISFALLFGSSNALADEIKMYLNGAEIAPLTENHQPAIVKEGELYLPLRNVFEAMGAIVEWDSLYQQVSGGSGGMNYETYVGVYTITVNGEEKQLESPVLLVNERTLVVPRAIIDCFGADVEWKESEKRVDITYLLDRGRILTVDFTDLEDGNNE